MRKGIVIVFKAGLGFLLVGLALMASLWFVLPPAAEFARVVRERPAASIFLDRNGSKLDVIYEEEHQSGVFIPLDSIPDFLLEDLEFFEDRSFNYNMGVSATGLARAIIGQFIGNPRAGGGSTLTMQLVRIISNEKDASYIRKLMEIVAATKLTFHLSKNQILDIYINNATWAPGPHSGIAYASNRLFSKRPSQLTRAEGILLISLLPNPSRATSEYDLAREYQNHVERLFQAKRITKSEYVSMLAGPTLRYSFVGATSYSVFLDRVVEEAREILAGSGWSLRDGLLIETTLDRTVNDSLYRVVHGALKQDAKVSLVFLNRENEVRAYFTASRERNGSYRGDFDLARAPGVEPASRFKIVIYAHLIESLFNRGFTANQILEYKLPTSCRVGTYVVEDAGAPDSVSLRNAIARSLNGPACWAANLYLGLDSVRLFARRLGIDLPRYASVALGTEGISELQLAGVFSGLVVRNGYMRRPALIRRILTADGAGVLYDVNDHRDENEVKVVSPRTSRVLRQALRDVVREGTARPLVRTSEMLTAYDIAAKTGTAKMHRGVTGSIGNMTFSLMIEGRGLGYASQSAVPMAALVLERFAAAAERFDASPGGPTRFE